MAFIKSSVVEQRLRINKITGERSTYITYLQGTMIVAVYFVNRHIFTCEVTHSSARKFEYVLILGFAEIS